MNALDLEPFKAPKILGDVFEAIIGAIFKDGGIEKCIDVLKSLMAPMMLYVAKFSKNIQKEPKEDFIQLSSQLKIRPHFQSTKIASQVLISAVIDKILPPADDILVPMVRVDIIHNNNQVMTSAYGSTNNQAERNASIKGI
jgi:dsRNA-specific ribonuclease